MMKMEPTVKRWNRKIDKQRKFYATTKRRKHGNVRFTIPTDEDRATFLNSNEFNISDSEALSKNIELKGKLKLIVMLLHEKNIFNEAEIIL